jgi:hypothetical protein
LGEKKFDRVEDCANEFLHFIAVNNVLFPESRQEVEFGGTVAAYWRNEFVRPLENLAAGENKSAKLLALLKKDIDEWKQVEPMDELGAGFGDRVIADYSSVLDELEIALFSNNEKCGPIQLTAKHKQCLRAVTRNMFTQCWFHPADLSGVVFAGMGEAELFPVCLEYHVGTVAAGKLRRAKRSETYVTFDMSACVAPFGQVDTINMFYRGIYQELQDHLMKTAADYISRLASKGDCQQIEKELSKSLWEQIDQQYRQPLMAAVDALPRQDLATMAEALVSLTALRARMAADEVETVAGPIDVAVLSKGEGFVWVKRKDGIHAAKALTEFVLP